MLILSICSKVLVEILFSQTNLTMSLIKKKEMDDISKLIDFFKRMLELSSDPLMNRILCDSYNENITYIHPDYDFF